MKMRYYIIGFLVITLAACQKDTKDPFNYNPTQYDLEIPTGFPQMDIPADNPMTVEGVKLGRMLFYDPILSGDGTQSCATCHGQSNSFTDSPLRFSTGIDGIQGQRNSMPLINMGWHKDLFWDGRAGSLEEQALEPVVNPVEMHNTWPNAVSNLQAHDDYPRLFGEAFGTSTIDSLLVAKAIAQFERTLISANSKFDDFYYRGDDLTESEQRGLDIFFGEAGQIENGVRGGDCFHCHGSFTFFTKNLFHNNGLDTDADFKDMGQYETTGDPNDRAKFKAPTLRNVELTAPYMHDGRFQTLEEVIEFYNSGVKQSSTVDVNMGKPGRSLGLQLSTQEKADLLAFLRTLTDHSFVNNPEFSDPF